jgi:hypothetical protein
MMALLKINNVVIGGKVARLSNFPEALADAWEKHDLFQKERSFVHFASCKQKGMNIGIGVTVLSHYLETGFFGDRLAIYDSVCKKYKH